MIFNRLFSKYLIDEAVLESETIKEYCDIADSIDTLLHIELVKNN
jgi:hypothetical protein